MQYFLQFFFLKCGSKFQNETPIQIGIIGMFHFENVYVDSLEFQLFICSQNKVVGKTDTIFSVLSGVFESACDGSGPEVLRHH